MAATVTLDKAYFEILMRRLGFNLSGEAPTTQLDLPMVTIPQCDHENLLRIAQEYTTLREALYRGGVAPDTLEVLIRGDYNGHDHVKERNEGTEDLGGVDLNQLDNHVAPRANDVTTTEPAAAEIHQPIRAHPGNLSGASRPGLSGPLGFSHDNGLLTLDPEKQDLHLARPCVSKPSFGRSEQRTICLKNLSDKVIHRDIIDLIRGGALLDIYIRSNDRSASVSFVEGSAAQAFMSYIKRKDLYIHGKRVEFSWNDRQFILPAHVAGKIESGATRNLIVRNRNRLMTAERIREDLEHIHNLVVIDITFKQGDAIISLNSVHNALFARTCMMSRATYKGSRIEWSADECSQDLPKTPSQPRKANPPAPAKKANHMINRFHMLNMDGTEDGSEESSEDILTGFSASHTPTQWSLAPVVA